MMHKFYSKVEIMGEVITVNKNKGYDLIRLMYRDQQSPAKFTNVFVWSTEREKVGELNLQKGDTILVEGELAFMEHAKNEKHGIRLSSIKRVGKLGF